MKVGRNGNKGEEQFLFSIWKWEGRLKVVVFISVLIIFELGKYT
jgi:hypothetical protein